MTIRKIVDWYNVKVVLNLRNIVQYNLLDIHSLAGLAVDRAGWRILVKRAVDTNGRWSHGV